MLDNNTFKKVAGDMAEYIQHSQDLLTSLQTENEELRKQASGSQKEASGSPSLDADGVENMVDHLIEAALLKEGSRQEAIDAMHADPNALVSFMDRLATKSMEKKAAATVRPLGKPHKQDRVIKEASSRESDEHYDNLIRGLRGRV